MPSLPPIFLRGVRGKIIKLGRHFSLAPLLWLALFPAAPGDQLPLAGLQQVTLGWTASSDPAVTGYYLYYGVASGVYTNKIDVGTNTTFTVGGLVAGLTYYFANTSYNVAGLESAFGEEISYVVPGILTIALSPDGSTINIRFPVAPNQSYDLQTSPDLESWSDLWWTPVEASNGWVEYDEPCTNTLSARFYRLILN